MGSQSASLAGTQWGHDRYLKPGRNLPCLRWLEGGQAQKTLGSSSETKNSQNRQAQRCTEPNGCSTWQVRMENRSPPDRLPGFVYDSLSIDPSPEAEAGSGSCAQGPKTVSHDHRPPHCKLHAALGWWKMSLKNQATTYITWSQWKD